MVAKGHYIGRIRVIGRNINRAQDVAHGGGTGDARCSREAGGIVNRGGNHRRGAIDTIHRAVIDRNGESGGLSTGGCHSVIGRSVDQLTDRCLRIGRRSRSQGIRARPGEA